jgi:hypothetical protein
MKIILSLMICALIVTPVMAGDEPIELAMKTFEVGQPNRGFTGISRGTGDSSGEPAGATYHVLAEDSTVLTDESGNQLRTE